jgi:GMP synthase-like glutamine amidotransferase
MKPVLIRQHLESAPPGLLADWLDARGLAYEVSFSGADGALPDPRDFGFVVSLGHDLGADDTHDAGVRAEREMLGRAVAAATPVLGLCYGGQVLAAVLGARVARAPVAELGWREIETDDPDAVPAGPWLEWHYERFETPPGAVELARTGDAVQAFRLGVHLGVQFHPEATVEIVDGWARSDGVDDVVLDCGAEARRAAADAAFRLFDAFVERGLGRRWEARPRSVTS